MKPTRMGLLLSALALSLCLCHSLRAEETKNVEKTVESRITAVTVYQNTALVTREVNVPEGQGQLELAVSALPPQTIDGTLYSEGTDGIRILSTRYRQRPVKEDVREEVRKLQAQIKEMQITRQNLESQMQVIQQTLGMLSKLETSMAAEVKTLTEKALPTAENTIKMAKYVLETRAEKAAALTKLQQDVAANQEQEAFLQRQLQEKSAGTSRVERDAVITVTKANNAAGKLRLNYLVSAAAWTPQYKFRSSTKDKDPVQVEYLAAIRQQTGEDWSNVRITLSTAQPMLSSAPPELQSLVCNVVPTPRGDLGKSQMPGQAGGGPGGGLNQPDALRQSRDYRQQAQKEWNEGKNPGNANKLSNEAAAIEQQMQLLTTKDEERANKQLQAEMGIENEGPSLTYSLVTQLSVPSRQDEHIVEVARIELQPDFYYKAVPVLTKHVYRVADLVNTSKLVLLPGEATMYIGTDFVGRTQMPLVAVGEQFRVGFGTDPQLQIQRQLVDKSRTMQGANQILKYEYRIMASSYKGTPVRVQVWDRLPLAETEVIGINIVKAQPEMSKDPLYLREERPKNLLRWDVMLQPTMNGEKAYAINYEFKMELDKQMRIGGFAPLLPGQPAPSAMPRPSVPSAP
jgi:hypothetical protein